MTQIEFKNKYQKATMHPDPKPAAGIVRLLLRYKVVRTKAQAEIILLVVVVVCVGFILMQLTIDSGSVGSNVSEIQDLYGDDIMIVDPL